MLSFDERAVTKIHVDVYVPQAPGTQQVDLAHML